MRALALLIATSLVLHADEPKIVVKPDAFETLVNPNCSHCVDEAKRRQTELQDGDPVLMWTRGKYDGGAIPIRFFLNPYRVISDTYGVFVYDPDAGYARGFKASLDFRFHGWRNGVMVMKHKDGTLYSCLTGIAFEGPRKGEKLETWPTLVSTWGWAMKHYPNTVAYHMFEKYKPVEIAKSENADSIASRVSVDKRMDANTAILGVHVSGKARAYRLQQLAKGRTGAVLRDRIPDGPDLVVLYDGATPSWAAYRPIAEKREATTKLSEEGKLLETREGLELVADQSPDKPPFLDLKTGSRFDVAGRGVDGPLKGWTLTPVESVVVKWFAWSAELPQTTIWSPPAADAPAPKSDPNAAIKQVAGTAEFLRAIPKKYATIQDVDATKRTVTLLVDGESKSRDWPLTDDAEIKIAGWWGRIEQLSRGMRVWVWFHSDRKKQPISVFMIADDASETDIHGKKEAAGALANLQKQRDWLRERWIADGLPGTISFVHIAGEVDLMLDHEAMRWGRSLNVGDRVSVVADPPINAVVKDMRPWRERTQVRLVINGLDIAELKSGQRAHLKMPTPPKEVDGSDYPSDIGRARSKEERVEWFLASIYCTCAVGGDICTGDFYTLASCNPNGCGAPNQTRQYIAKLIDGGMTDKQIYDKLKSDRGPLMTRSHLRP